MKKEQILKLTECKYFGIGEVHQWPQIVHFCEIAEIELTDPTYDTQWVSFIVMPSMEFYRNPSLM